MAGWFYHTALPAYRMVQRTKNAALQFFDFPVAVLLYHRVTVTTTDHEWLAVSPDNFRAQMTYLKENFHLVRLEDDWSTLSGPAVCITFDDGYADNVLEALPILEEISVPATFFISTGKIGTNHEFWWDQLGRILLTDGNFPGVFTLVDQQHGRSWRTESMAQRQTLYVALNALAQTVETERLEVWLGQLSCWANAKEHGAGANRAMTWDELQLLARSPLVTIGAHTVSHSALSALTEEQQRYEIMTSKEALEKRTGTKITVFSYPFGNRKHYTPVSIALCRELGFDKAAANFPGLVHRWTDHYQLPRQVVRNWNLNTFAANMKNWIR